MDLYRLLQGYHLGQFRIPIEKMLPYETDIRIPLFIKGPGMWMPCVLVSVQCATSLTCTVCVVFEFINGTRHQGWHDDYSAGDEYRRGANTA